MPIIIVFIGSALFLIASVTAALVVYNILTEVKFRANYKRAKREWDESIDVEEIEETPNQSRLNRDYSMPFIENHGEHRLKF